MVNSSCAREVVNSALNGAREAIKKAGGKKNIIIPRVLPVPSKTGGFLPFLLPAFAGLSAIGAIANGASGVMKTINQAKQARQQLEESTRHNKQMEALLLGKGLYMKPYKSGMGLYMKPGKGLKIKKKKSSK